MSVEILPPIGGTGRGEDLGSGSTGRAMVRLQVLQPFVDRFEPVSGDTAELAEWWSGLCGAPSRQSRFGDLKVRGDLLAIQQWKSAERRLGQECGSTVSSRWS